MIEIRTAAPVAADSLDHLYPHGTAGDNSVLPAFNSRLFEHWPRVRLLDIGCSGGGLVKSILDDGRFAVGVEGSDYSKCRKRAEWATIPDNLFTADATQPFQLSENNERLTFDVVTAWEVMEHIPILRLRGFFDNVRSHLALDGAFICSVCTVSAGLSPEGIEHHVTIRCWDWWLKVFSKNGFIEDKELRDFFDQRWVRGPNTGVPGSYCTVFRPQ